MNETKTLEAQLGSWKPRRPGARLEQKIFGPPEADPGLRALMRVVAPVAACLMFTVVMLNQPDRSLAIPAAGPGALLAMSLSNQNYAAYLPGSFQLAANRLDTFGWTNGGGCPSSTFSILPGKAND